MPEIPPPQDHLTNIDAKLSAIMASLDAINRRDRLRTVGGFFRGLIGIIPIAILVWSTWYFIYHGEELMNRITRQAAEQAQQSVQVDDSLMQQLESMLNKGE